MNTTKLCCHYLGGESDTCAALNGKTCNGFNESCSFYKTEKQFNDDLNKSILLCREKGLCERCTYFATKCKVIPYGVNKRFKSR